MPTTFNAISVGQLADIDTTEGNNRAENAAALEGLTFGGPGNPLVNDFVEVSPFGNVGSAYDMDNSPNDQFTVDGGSPQSFDGTAVYNATITYVDGTTATYTAVLFQDTNGNAYLAPEFSNNADQAALEAGPIQSISLDSLLGNRYSGLTTSREEWDFVPCFVEGTKIITQSGEHPVEKLQLGDMILTMDHGFQPLRWVGRRTVPARGVLAPIRFAPGALGNDVPLMVSPQHRMMLRGWRVEVNFGESEVLVPALALINGDTVVQVEGGTVTYLHLLFDCHEIIYGGGIPSESFMPGEQGLSSMAQAVQDEIYTLFPELQTEGLHVYGEDARPSLKAHEAQILVH
ncbi:Hint domain-containing protein [Shimia sagamensis]|uniref:Hint domain-containing protein n=1 Tax=Shimia sagamensis TaxID=1566352 RepID=A0ABY1NMN7_9RHOB|nr:Hint domain-containing protein [Shimia sagamensis]SMP13774.1 Hint domain-containing protein [Shimia sagamensis]